MNFSNMSDEQLIAINHAIVAEMNARNAARLAQEALDLLISSQAVVKIKPASRQLRANYESATCILR